MPQSLFNALIMGAKETQSAKKVIKFSAHFGFVAIGLAMTFLFLPVDSLQAAIDKIIPNKSILIGAAALSAVCMVLILKEKIWAPCILVALIIGDMIITYMDTKELPGAISCIQLVIYGSAAQAIYFISQQQKEDIIEVQDQEQ